MKKQIMVFVILLIQIPTLLRSQELKKITHALDPFNKEEYYVLKTNKKIMHGPYLRINYFDQMLEEGFYKMGKRDSTWKFTYGKQIRKIENYKADQKHGTWITYGKMLNNQPLVRDSGTYYLDKKTGIWKYNDPKGEPDLVFDYDQKQILYQKPDSLEHWIISGTDTLSAVLDRSPIYADGWGQFYSIIAKNLRLPQYFVRSSQGYHTKIYISFFISESGTLEDLKAINKRKEALSNQAMLAIVATDINNWLPGIYQGRPVKTQIIIPFNFSNQGLISQ